MLLGKLKAYPQIHDNIAIIMIIEIIHIEDGLDRTPRTGSCVFKILDRKSVV